MKKFLLILCLLLGSITTYAVPTITIDGDNSEWAEVPMLSQPGTWPVLKVLPAADANIGSNALVYMIENSSDFEDALSSKYPTAFIDKDYNISTNPVSCWQYTAMGVDYKATTAYQIGDVWYDCESALDGKVIEIGIPNAFISDLESTFGFAMYYGSGAWYVPEYDAAKAAEISIRNGYVYKSRPYQTLPGVLRAENAYTHQSIGDCTDYIDFGIRDGGAWGGDTALWAAFPINLTTPASYEITANVTTNSASWNFEFWLVNVATNSVVAHIDKQASSISSSKSVYKFGTLDLSSVPVGKYMLMVKNRTQYSEVQLHNLILTSTAGAVSELPCTLVPIKSKTSAQVCIDATGEVDTIKFNSSSSQYAQWKVSVATKRPYQFTANTYNKYGHNYKISILNASDESEAVTPYQEKASGTNFSTGHVRVHTPIVELNPGNYIIKIENLTNTDNFGITSIETNGVPVNIPSTLNPVDALLSDSAGVVFGTPNCINFKYKGSKKWNDVEWAKWNVNVTKAGKYKFTANVTSTNSQKYRLNILNSDETPVTDGTIEQASNIGTGDRSFSSNRVDLAAGNYIVKIANIYANSDGKVVNIVATYEGGAVTALPGQIVGDEALLTGNIIRLENRDLKSSNTSSPTAEYAEWNVSFAEAGTMAVQLNLDPVTSSGHNYRVELYDGNELKGYAEEMASTEPGDANHDKGDIDLAQTIEVPAAGNYTVKLVNRTQWSSMILHGITFAPYVAPADVTMADTDEDNTAWVNYVSETVDVQLNRTILGGMYNTICLPFPVSSTKCKAIFGNDVELYTLGSATLSGDILNLQFNVADDIYQGTPVLIKTSSDIVNPLFAGVEIIRSTPSSTVRGIVTFQGTFTQQTFHAGDQVLLLVANNKLAYPLQDRVLKGFRAYFGISNPQSSAPIRGARIVAGEQMVTAFDLVEVKVEEPEKVIENGQLIIIRDGVRYNALGLIIQ